MPVPHASCPADVPSDVCCDTFWMLGERIRTVASEAVFACIDSTCSDRIMRSYQTEGENIEDPLGDSLIVSFVRAMLRQDSRTPNQSTLPLIFTRVEFKVQLLERGWPTLQERPSTASIIAPDADMIHALAKHSRGHAERMWRAIVNGAATTNQAQKLFSSSANPHVVTHGVTIEELKPLPNAGPFIGYSFNVAVDTKLC